MKLNFISLEGLGFRVLMGSEAPAASRARQRDAVISHPLPTQVPPHLGLIL